MTEQDQAVNNVSGAESMVMQAESPEPAGSARSTFLDNAMHLTRKCTASILLAAFVAGGLSSCATQSRCKAPIGHKGSKSSAQRHTATQVWKR